MTFQVLKHLIFEIPSEKIGSFSFHKYNKTKTFEVETLVNENNQMAFYSFEQQSKIITY